jgi:hypothetical protein
MAFGLRVAGADLLGDGQTLLQVNDSLGRIALGAIDFTQVDMAIGNAKVVA